jgi:hypothetical protein
MTLSWFKVHFRDTEIEKLLALKKVLPTKEWIFHIYEYVYAFISYMCVYM